jgi:hypothetical protein
MKYNSLSTLMSRVDVGASRTRSEASGTCDWSKSVASGTTMCFSSVDVTPVNLCFRSRGLRGAKTQSVKRENPRLIQKGCEYRTLLFSGTNHVAELRSYLISLIFEVV